MIFFALFILLFWFALVGKVTLEVLLIGLGLTLLVILIAHKILPPKLKAYLPLSKLWMVIKYLLQLVKEIILANIDMIKIVLSPDISDLQPALGYFRIELESEFSKMVLANSITITPGTITVFVKDNEYMIHVLDKNMLQDITQSSFVKEIRKIENKTH